MLKVLSPGAKDKTLKFTNKIEEEIISVKKAISLTALAGILVFVLVAIPAPAKPTHPTFGTFVNAGNVPAGSTLVLNVTYKVSNDEDSGLAGYWAIANYNKRLQVWQAPDKVTYYVVAAYAGTWQTFAGALSPGAGLPQSRDGSGTFQGGYFASFNFTGDFNPGEFKAMGSIEAMDFGGTKEDVLLGTYGAGQTGPTAPVNVLNLYFPGYGSFEYVNWGWTYHYRGQTWNNFDYGTTGDILF